MESNRKIKIFEKNRLHLICNAHVDPVWQWTRDEGIAAALSTFESAVRLSKQYDYIFCHNEAFLYEYVEEYSPELFSEIKRLIAAGKWHIMGGWYLQPDCNMPSGESIIRQIEMGREYFFQKFGVKPTVAVNVDPFGHSRGLIQILKKCGYSGYIVGRPSKALLPLPKEQFLWKGFDESIIKVCRIEKYATLMGHATEHILYTETQNEEPSTLVFWGLGNHGGGPSEKDLIDIARFQAQGKPWLHSTPERFFSECVPENVWEHPLTHVFPGCYSALARIKKIHAQLENDLYITEALCSYAALNEICDYPSTETELAQKDLLQIEFHDVLAGTCTKTCEMASIDTAAHGREILKRVFDKTFFALVNGEPRAKRDEYPLFVFNPLPYETKACVQSEFTLNPSNDGENDDSFVYAYGQNGVLLPCQVVKEESNLNWDCRKKIAILASLAPMSVTRISLFSEKTIKKKRQLSVLPFLGNEYFAEINPQSGKLEKYVVQGKELFTDGVGLVLYDDTPDPWAMGEKQQKKLGENPESFDFTPVPMATFKNEKGCRLIESGKVYNKIESFFQKENIFARIVYTLYRDLPYIDLEVNILFNACDKAVKLAFPLSFCGEFFGQTSFGREHLESDGRECCAQRFTMLKRSDGYAFILLNRSSYAFSYENGILFTTLLRGATYCAHPIGNRKLIPDDRYSEKTDQGEHIFSFRLIYDRAERAEMHANEFCHLPYALNIFPAERGPRADKFSLELSSPEITLSSFRKRKDGYLIRLFNPADEKKNVRIKCGRGGVNATFSAFEVKTFAYKKGILRERESMLPEIDFTKGTRRKND